MLMPQSNVRVNDDGSVTISPDLARAYGLTPGATARAEARDNSLVIRRAPSHLNRVYVELTSECNIDCTTCMRNVWGEELGRMSRETFARILEDIGALDDPPEIFFGGFGEPFAHPEALEWIIEATSVASSVELITNGTMLTEPAVDALIGAGVNTIWVSLDGATPESYSDVRLGATLPRVIDNLKTLKRRRIRASTEYPRLGVAFVAMERNIHELPAVIDLGLTLGAERFSVSNLLAHSEEMRAETLYAYEQRRWKSIGYDVDLPRMDAMNPEVARALARVISPARSSAGMPRLNLFPEHNSCPFIEKGSTSIRWDGHVSPCLSLLHTHQYYLENTARTSHAHDFGSVHERSLSAVWSDPAYVDLRERLYDFSFSPCTSCVNCERAEENAEDCLGNEGPACGGCLWAQGFIRCP
jgi:MoaA/NifB/PqqE/SkfB family radical SAM enzyme